MEPNHLCNFEETHHEEQFCEIIMKLDKSFRRRCDFKMFLIWKSGGPFNQQSVTIRAILVEVLVGTIL